MLIKILGAIDILIGIILIFGLTDKFPTNIILIIGFTFILKSLLGMLKDFTSWIDFTTGIIILLSIIFSIPSWILIILGILEIQKGVFSFV